MSEDTKTEKRTTSAEIKKQIEEATKAQKEVKDLKESGLPLSLIANQVNALNPIPETPSSTVSKPDPATAAEEKTTSNNVDLQEWAKKRGINWTDDSNVLSALRKSDMEFHKRREEEKAKATEKGFPFQPHQPQAYPPPQSYPPANGYQPNGYQPNGYPPQPNRQSVEQIARQYNMLPEDVERLAAFNRDFFDVLMRNERAQSRQEIESIKRENEKNSVFRELSSDPVFKRPDVGQEFHAVLDEMQKSDPQSFEQDPNAYKRAYDRALINIARRNLEGQLLAEGIPPQVPLINSMSIPTKPPRPLGQGSGGGSEENENGIDASQFAKLSLEEKRKVLDRMGLRPGY